jgi:HEPN domain-containing protein
MDIEEQIEYWKTGSAEDLAAAESLFEKGHLRHCLFLAHWALEKMLKAHVTRQTRVMPPRIHSLPRLAAMAGLKLDGEQMDFLREFGAYQIEGRYPDAEQLEIDSDLAREELRGTREMLAWLSRQL